MSALLNLLSDTFISRPSAREKLHFAFGETEVGGLDRLLPAGVCPGAKRGGQRGLLRAARESIQTGSGLVGLVHFGGSELELIPRAHVDLAAPTDLLKLDLTVRQNLAGLPRRARHRPAIGAR